MRYTARMSAAMKATRMRELRALGYTSDVFEAKYRGGKCGLSGMTIQIGAQVAFFRTYGLCLAPKITAFLDEERRAKNPVCGCGRKYEATDSNACCMLCAYVCEHYFELFATEVTRDSNPVEV